MRNLIIAMALIFASVSSYAFERPFRIDRYASIKNGLAIAWGIPGQDIDFEKLDTLSNEEIEKEIDLGSIRNFLVDINTNKIIATLGDGEYVTFSIGEIHWGNHYNLSLDALEIQDFINVNKVITVTQNFKWSSFMSNIFIVNTEEVEPRVSELDASYTMNILMNKLKLSILPKNMKHFTEGAESITSIEGKYIDNVGEVNIITFNYSFPKSDISDLEVVVTTKMKYENGQIVPYILSVKQKLN